MAKNKLITTNSDAYREALRDCIPRSYNHFQLYLQTFLESRFLVPHIPRNSVCEHHSFPMQYLYDLFTEKYENIIVLANRHGMKTLSNSINNMLCLVFKGVEVANIGAIQTQAEKCYKYTQSFFANGFQHWLQEEPRMHQTTTKNGGILNVLTGTLSGVNSPHPCVAVLDEIELMRWDILQQAFSMPGGQKGFKPQIILTSTRKFPYGSMERMLKEAAQRNFKVFTWCIWETVQKCELKCSECLGSHKKFGTLESFKDRCQGKARRADGFRSLQEAVNTYYALDHDVWLNEWECLKPGTTGLVYQFTDDLIIDNYEYNPQWQTFAGQDWGWENPLVSLFIQITPSEDVIVFCEEYHQHKTVEQLVAGIYKNLNKQYNVRQWVCDPESPGDVATCKNHGINAISCPRAQVNESIKIVRRFIQAKKLKVSRNCKKLIEELQTYHLKTKADGEISDEVEKENDHGPDALRYFMWWKFGGKQPKIRTL